MEKKTEKKEGVFHGWDVARFHINFPNGNYLSTVWGEGTYSDCHDSRAMTDYLLKRTTERPVFDSSTVEIMFTCAPKLQKKIEERYGEGSQPIGYLSLKKWLEIVNLLATQRTRKITKPKGRTK